MNGSVVSDLPALVHTPHITLHRTLPREEPRPPGVSQALDAERLVALVDLQLGNCRRGRTSLTVMSIGLLVTERGIDPALGAAIAERLVAGVRRADTVVSAGPGELLVIARADAGGAAAMRARLARTLKMPYRLGARAATPDIAIGVGVSSAGISNAAALLAQARQRS